MIKNCHNCRNLEWHDDADTDGHNGPDSGWSCSKREPTEKHVNQLQDYRYLRRYKSCYDLKETK